MAALRVLGLRRPSVSPKENRNFVPSITPVDSISAPALKRLLSRTATQTSGLRGDNQSSSLEEFIPRCALEYLATATTSGSKPSASISSLHAVIAFLDGSELVCAILSEYFSALLQVVSRWGGDTIKFAGDALIVAFTIAENASTEIEVLTIRRAIQCSLEATAIKFSVHDVALFLKVAVGMGSAFMVNVGVNDRWEVMIAGPPLLQIGAIEHEAAISTVVISTEVWKRISGEAIGKQNPSGSVVITALNEPPSEPEPIPPVKTTQAMQELIAFYVPRTGRSPSLAPVRNVACLCSEFLAVSARERLQQGIPRKLLADIREVSVVFINLPDIVTSDAAMLDPLFHAFSVCATTLTHYWGTMRQFLQEDKGVTCIGVFGLPGQCAGDDAVRAVKAALQIFNLLEKGSKRAAIGVTTGKAYCGIIGSSWRHEYATVGAVVNLSARLMAAAEKLLKAKGGPQILCDEETYQQAHSSFVWYKPEPIMVKGKTEAVVVRQPTVRALSEKMFATAAANSVGRDKENEAPNATLRVASNTGKGAVLLIEAEQGLGKSLFWESLVREHRLSLAKVTTRKIEANSPFASLARLLSRLFRVERSEKTTPRSSFNYTEETVTQLLVKAQKTELIPYLPLLNLGFHLSFLLTRESAQIEGAPRRAKIFEIVACVIQLVIDRPNPNPELGAYVLVIEDAHDMDASSWEFVRHIASNTQLTNQLWVLPHRPMRTPPGTYADIIKLPIVTKVNLCPLPDEHIAKLICNTYAVRQVPPQVSNLVCKQAQGNPFIATVLMESIIDAGVCKVNAGVMSVEESLLTVSATPSHALERVFVSKIDKLASVPALVLRVCSCIGSEFAVATLQGVMPLQISAENLLNELNVLQQSRFIRCDRVDEAGKPLHYTFTSTIVHEVAYNTFAFASRRAIHQSVAVLYAKEKKTSCGADDSAFYSVIAQHFERAEVWLQAAEYLKRAGEANAANANLVEAVAAFESALNIEKKAPGTLSKVHQVYFHRILFDLKLLAGMLSAMDSLKYYTTNVFPVINFVLPKNSAEIRAVIPGMRKQWIREHFRGAPAQLCESEEERPIYVELAKCALRCYRAHIHVPRDPESSLWHIFWAFYMHHWGEMGDSPDLCYLYATTATLQFTMSTTDRMMQYIMPRNILEKAVAEAARTPQPKLVTLFVRLFHSSVTNLDFPFIESGYEELCLLWKQLSPEELAALGGIDSHLVYEDALSTFGAHSLTMGNWQRALEIGQEIGTTTKAKSMKAFEEVSCRHQSMALIHLGRYEEAQKLLELQEQRGTNRFAERPLITWLARWAMLSMLRGDFAAAVRYLAEIVPKVGKMSAFVFFAIYVSTMHWIVAETWEHFCGKLGKMIDILAPIPKDVRESPLGPTFAILSNLANIIVDKIWEQGANWPSLSPDAYYAHARYFVTAGRMDKALQCWRKALHIAERRSWPYVQAKAHMMLGKHVAEAGEAVAHLRKSMELMELKGAVWEKQNVRELLKKREAEVELRRQRSK